MTTNRCQRLTYSMIRSNSERAMSLCPEISDGMWSSWESWEACQGRRTVRGYSGHCGEGYQRERRHCIRELGGNACQDENTEYFREFLKFSEDFELRTANCSSTECPGESDINIYKQTCTTSLAVISATESETFQTSKKYT